jgi:hypothetical protein
MVFILDTKVRLLLLLAGLAPCFLLAVSGGRLWLAGAGRSSHAPPLPAAAGPLCLRRLLLLPPAALLALTGQHTPHSTELNASLCPGDTTRQAIGTYSRTRCLAATVHV